MGSVRLADFGMRRSTIPVIAGRIGTRERLMASGERLIGLHGMENLPLDRIARDAAQANKFAVQYHFGSRRHLAQAILDLRVGELDRRRGAYLEAIGPSPSLEALVAGFVLPIAEQVEEEGRFAFARFLLQYSVQLTPWPGVEHPATAGLAHGHTRRLFTMLGQRVPAIEEMRLHQRLGLLLNLPLVLLSSHAAHADRPGQRAELDDAIGMIAAALASDAAC